MSTKIFDNDVFKIDRNTDEKCEPKLIKNSLFFCFKLLNIGAEPVTNLLLSLRNENFEFHLDFLSTNDAPPYTRLVGFLSTIYR